MLLLSHQTPGLYLLRAAVRALAAHRLPCTAAAACLVLVSRVGWGAPARATDRPGTTGCTPACLPDYDIRDGCGGNSGSATPVAGRSQTWLGGGANTSNARRALAEFLDRHRLRGISRTRQVPGARTSRRFVTEHNGLTHLTFQQQHQGIDILGASLRASVTRSGRILTVSSTMLDGPSSGFRPEPFTLPPDRAVEAATSVAPASSRCAFRHAGVQASDRSVPQTPSAGRALGQSWSSTLELGDGASARRVYFPMTSSELRPAWEVILPVRGASDVYEITIDAADGRLLRRWNRRQSGTTEPATFRVFSSDSPAPGSPGDTSPSGTQFPFVASELVLVDPGVVGVWSPSGWIDDGDNETAGNNVDAHLDLDGNDQPDLPRPAGVPYRVFDFPSSHPNQDPADYGDASVVQLFYVCNTFHDRLYELGFTEAAGNFQVDNFSRGGVGGDPIVADAQDGADVNAASFTTGAADGTAARLEVHLFTGPSPARDGAFERDLVYHELAHGVSVRLLEALPAGAQPQALREGWGDFLALALGAETGDDPQASYPFAPYVSYLYEYWGSYDDNYYFGLRRFPYCTDLNKNPLTYADIDPAQEAHPPGVPKNPNITTPADERHNAGEAWCMALMECRAEFMERYGFGGNQRMLQLVIDGMMLSPSSPTFLDARDAILSADWTDNAGDNLDVLWAAFAKRGLGASAVSPTTGVTGIVEAFDVPDMLVFAYPDGLPAYVPPAQGTTFRVRIQALGASSPIPGTAMLHYSIDGGSVVDTMLTTNGARDYEATLPAADCASHYEYYFSMNDAVLGTVTDPPSAPGDAFEAFAALETGSAFYDEMESDLGWTAGAPGDITGAGVWNRMDPEGTYVSGTPVQAEDDHSVAPGAKCWVTDGLAGGSAGQRDVDGGKTTLTSPPFSATGENAIISYWRWYSNDEGATVDDVFEAFVSNNGGGDWQPVETLGPVDPEASGGWFCHEFLATDVAPPSVDMRLRFVASDYGGSSLVEAAIDDVTVTVFYCAPPAPGDANRDGLIDVEDHAVFAACLAGLDTSPPTSPPNCLEVFDFDADLDVDLEDFAAFEALIAD